jgi:integrase
MCYNNDYYGDFDMPRRPNETYTTPGDIEALTKRQKYYRVIDARMRGLIIKVQTSGTKTFCIRGKTQFGKPFEESIGHFGTLTLNGARKIAPSRIIEAQKAHPVEAKRRAKRALENSKMETVSAIAAKWAAEHKAKVSKNTSDKEQRYLNLYILPELGQKRLAELTRTEIERFLKTVLEQAKTKRNGTDGIASHNHCRTILSQVFDFAIKKLDMDITNRVLATEPIKAVVRDRTLSELELKTIWNALLQAEAKKQSATNARLIKFQLTTLQRSGEVAAMLWSEVDIVSNHPTWTIPAEKYKGKHTMVVPLSSAAVKILVAQRNPNLGTKGVFGDVKDGHAVQRAFNRLCERLVIKDARMHDQRRTGRTLLTSERLGISLETAERVIGHTVSSSLVRTYDKNDYLPQKREALEKWAELLEEIVA